MILKPTIKIVIGLTLGLAVSGTAYAAYDYTKVLSLIDESKKFVEEEKYNISIGLLEEAENRFISKKLGIKSEQIGQEKKKQEKMTEDRLLLGSTEKEIANELFEIDYQEQIEKLSTITKDSKYVLDAKLKIEEIKRLQLEEELGVEKAARVIAESQAEKEKTAKQTALNQVAQKNSEENRLSSDKDGDGLSTREEEKLGTSDYDDDSDDDGILDGEDINPTGGGRLIPQTFTWNYGGYVWEETLTISEDWYDYYKAKDRETEGGVAEVHGLQFVTSQDPFIKSIGAAIKNVSEIDDLNETELALSFVQSLSYVEDFYTGYDEYPKYPVETFFEKNGDCEDTSYLAASLIDSMDIGAAIIILPNHMAVGVWMTCDNPGYYYQVGERCYYYAETTDEGWGLGDMPSEHKKTFATVIEVRSGAKKQVQPEYVSPCVISSEITGYYTDGVDYYSDKFCTWEATCMPYKGYFTDMKELYHDSWCEDIVTAGCYKSSSYAGKYYSGNYWYNDSTCISLYKSMSCTYPYSWAYSCTTQSDYTYKASLYSGYTSDLATQYLQECQDDINTYQQELNEYNNCLNKQEP